MAPVIPPHRSSPSLDPKLALNEAAKPAGKAVAPVQAPGGSAVQATGDGGLAISEAGRIQIRSLAAAERSANDVIAMAQTADGALGQMGGLLERMREVARGDAGDNVAPQGSA